MIFSILQQLLLGDSEYSFLDATVGIVKSPLRGATEGKEESIVRR
jgi:hypothetical protein